MDIQSLIKNKARSEVRQILLIEGEDERVVKAASLAAEERICEPVLLGRKELIVKAASKAGANLDGVGIEEYHNHAETEAMAEKLCELRKKKGLKIDQAKNMLKDPNYFGAMLVKLGKYDGAVGGCSYSTAAWMRPVFQIIGTKEGIGTVSAVCMMVIKDKLYFFSDTDFVIEPDSAQLADIAVNASDFAKALGVNAKVALLSYSTHGSGEHPCLEHIREAMQNINKRRPDIVIDGEIQLDAAVSVAAAEKKCSGSILKGDANVLVFPHITVGNVLIHAMNQWTDYELYGSFPQGLGKAIMNGGRSFDARQICDTIAGCAMQVNLK
ncbi:MAG: phosphate acyltransferase [archaeon]